MEDEWGGYRSLPPLPIKYSPAQTARQTSLFNLCWCSCAPQHVIHFTHTAQPCHLNKRLLSCPCHYGDSNSKRRGFHKRKNTAGTLFPGSQHQISSLFTRHQPNSGQEPWTNNQNQNIPLNEHQGTGSSCSTLPNVIHLIPAIKWATHSDTVPLHPGDVIP